MSQALLRSHRLATRLPELQAQQKRFAGNLPVQPNKYIEQWGTFREHVPMANGFTWDAQTIRRVVVWAGLVPFGIFTMTKKEFQHTDREYSRKERELM